MYSIMKTTQKPNKYPKAGAIFNEFLKTQKEENPNRTYRWWAKRWRVNFTVVGGWAIGYRRVGVNNVRVWADLINLGGIRMHDYYWADIDSRKKGEVT